MNVKLEEDIAGMLVRVSKLTNKPIDLLVNDFLRSNSNDLEDVYTVEHRLENFQDGGTLEDFKKKYNSK